MKNIRLYRAFVPWWYFYLILLLVPATFAFLYVERIFAGKNAVGIAIFLWIQAELLLDSFFLGGLHSKYGMIPGLFLASRNGKTCFRQLLCMDLIQRTVSAFLVSCGLCLLWYQKLHPMLFIFSAILILITGSFAYLSRYHNNRAVEFLLEFAGILVYNILLILTKYVRSVRIIVLLLAPAVLYALWRKANKKWEECYYDQTDLDLE